MDTSYWPCFRHQVWLHPCWPPRDTWSERTEDIIHLLMLLGDINIRNPASKENLNELAWSVWFPVRSSFLSLLRSCLAGGKEETGSFIMPHNTDINTHKIHCSYKLSLVCLKKVIRPHKASFLSRSNLHFIFLN